MKPSLPFSYIVALLLLIANMLSGQAHAVPISVSVDRNPVTQDESFKILFTASDAPDGDPDFSPLQQDFEVLNQNQSSNTSWVNGNFSKSIQWIVEVTAKKTGEVVIPAIQFGNDTSEPLPIIVKPSGTNTNSGQENEEIFLDVKAEPVSPYVQSQVIYVVRVYRRIDIAQAELTEPELPDAVIEKLGDDNNFNTVVNGVQYLVTERKYAIFPQKSVKMTIKPLALTAQVIVDRRLDFNDFFGSRMTKTKRVLSKEITLDVKAAPPEFKDKHWLAAEQLELGEKWSSDPKQLKAGEPVTRTLTLRGIGTTVGQLPEINAAASQPNLKTYPDKPTLNESKQADGITATREEKIALIPTSGGKLTLPAIEIPWFNTKSKKMEIARIPEMVIEVAGGVEKQAPSLTPPANKLAESTTNTSPAQGKLAPKASTSLPATQGFWPYLCAFLAFGWIVTLVFFLRKQKKQVKNVTPSSKIISEESLMKQAAVKLKQACSDNDAQAAKTALLKWGQIKFGANSLSAIADHCQARLRDEILILNRSLYSGGDNTTWNGKKLFQAFSENKAMDGIQTREDTVLEPLHRI